MIFKGVKYACGTCIKGHRSSNCNHVERPLFEIRRKGRPVTQCSICRDLRKTKQVHIKCACIHKSAKEQSPILISQESEGTTSVIDTELQLSLVCDDVSKKSGQVSPISYDAPPFSWAVVTPTPPTDEASAAHLGFIFHKPTSQRFLEGQPRPPRKKSIKKSSNVASCPPPLNVILPTMDTSSSSVNSDNGDFSGDLTMILNSLLQQDPPQEEEQMMNQDMGNINNDLMMYPSSPYQSPYSTPSYVSQLMMDTNEMDLCNNSNNSNNSSRTGSISFESMYPPMVGCCGSPQPMCQPSENGGESVVITIAPLSPTTHLPNSEFVRTRVVTCYCAGNCACPGCLVHPGNVLVGDPMMDPYGFSTDAAAICPSSTASSIYSTSDDEDQLYPSYPLLR